MVIPQVWLSPADSSAQSRSGATGWGRLRSSVSPTPSWPASFAPQQNASCCLVTAQECSLPAVTCLHCVCPAILEKCGISFRSSLVPSPTWPRLLRPQQARNPLDSNRPQVWFSPATSILNDLGGWTISGSRVSSPPEPSWP